MVRLCWKKYAYIEKKVVGGQTVLEKICINGKNGWVGDFGVFADFSASVPQFFSWPPPPPAEDGKKGVSKYIDSFTIWYSIKGGG